MTILKRDMVIELLKDGAELIEDRWIGYSYCLFSQGKGIHGTVRFRTARYLIMNKLVSRRLPIAPFTVRYIWAGSA